MRVVGAFVDGRSALMRVAARLCYVAGARRGKLDLNVTRLAHTAVAWIAGRGLVRGPALCNNLNINQSSFRESVETTSQRQRPLLFVDTYKVFSPTATLSSPTAIAAPEREY